MEPSAAVLPAPDPVAASPDFSNVRFEFAADYEKAWQDEKTGRMRVRAIASDDQLDLQRDRMSHRALQKMADAAKSGVPLLETHRSVFDFGRTVGGQVIERQGADGRTHRQFLVELELDGEYPQARKLWREIAGGRCDKQLSIGGKLNLKNRDAVTVMMTPAGLSRTINDLDLDHIASTRKSQAANPRTSFLEAIAKALDGAEEAGWNWQNPLAKQGGGVQNTPPNAMDAASASLSDIQLGAAFLAKIGRAAREGGADVNKTAMTPMTPTTPMSPATPPATTPAMTPMPAAKAQEAAALLGEITALLSKAQAEKAAPAVEAELRGLRDRLQKMVQDATAGPGEKPSAQEAAGVGAGAFNQDTSAAKPGYSPDKAPKGGSTDIAGSNVTGHQNDIQVGGEIKATAPTAKAAYAHTLNFLKLDGIVKALGEDGASDIEKAFAAVVEQGATLTQDIVVAAVEKVLEEQQATAARVEKTVGYLGAALNDTTRRLAKAEGDLGRLAEVEKRLARVEKSGAVSQSGPRGAADSSVHALARRSGQGGVWGGLFDDAKGKALGKF